MVQVCVDSDWPVPDCRGGLSSLSPLPSFQSVAVLVGVSLWAVWTSVLCLCLFRFCSAATVYKICAWLQLTAGKSLLLLLRDHTVKFNYKLNASSSQALIRPTSIALTHTYSRFRVPISTHIHVF